MSVAASLPIRSGRRRPAMIAPVLGMLALAVAGEGIRGQDVNPRGLAVHEFQKRLTDYVSVHKRVAGTVPALKETDSPTQIAAREKLLGDAIREARSGATSGELFDPVATIVREVVRQDWDRRSVRERRALLSEVPKGLRVVPNMVYPTTVPLATSPPALIEALPRLPDELEYRFLGRHLILRDVKANLVVDILADAVPSTGS